MSFYPPTIHADNTAYSSGFNIIKTKVKSSLASLLKGECYMGLDYVNLNQIQINHLVMVYMQIIYLRLASSYNTLTLDEVLELYDYSNIKTCFACNGIDLDAILNSDQFNFDDP